METPRVTYSQVLCAVADAAGGISLACILGYTSTALLSMASDPHLDITEEQGSWIGAIVPGMALIGSLVAGQILERLGRKRTLMITSIPSALAWLFIAYSTSPLQVIFARAVSGICLGIQQVGVSVFVSETIHPKLQPMFGIIPGIATMIGFIAINVTGSIADWRVMSWLGFSSSLFMFLLFNGLPETPYFLLKSEREKQSLDTLKWLRPTEAEAQKEFKELSQTLSSSNKKEEVIKFTDMIQPPYRWPFSVAILLHVFQQTTGVGALMSFMGIIFERSGSAVDPNVATIVMTVINMGSIFMFGKYIGKYPRKAFINVSTLFMIVPLVILAGYMYAREQDPSGLSDILTYIPFITISTYMLGFSIGWAPLPWMFIRDSLPIKIRGSGAGIVVATNWAMSFLITKTYSWGTILLGYHTVYIIYALCTLLGMVIMNYQIPETFGLNEIKLEQYYRDSYKKKTR